jgi:hypothetical protein
MKNLFLLPTDKPSRLYFYKGDDAYPTQYGLRSLKSLPFKDSFTNQNIYITSDEEIKEGDWALSLCDDESYGEPYKVRDVSLCDEEDKKIILTTDQDLIKDGVQAIDDDFLEWFVKNPSCETVEVDKGYRGVDLFNYKIIIPKEEPKEFDIRELNRLDDIEIEEMSNDWATMSQQIKPKQETLEEVAERILANNIDGLRDALQDDDLFFFYKGVIQCYGEAMVEWQAERMYSEEEFIVMINEIVEKHCTYFEQKHKDTVKLEWFEQFKKK